MFFSFNEKREIFITSMIRTKTRMVSIRFQRWHGIVVSTSGCGPEYLGSNLAKVRFLTPPNISLWVYDPGGGLVKNTI